MNRRTVTGLSLLCVFAFCAFGAPSAFSKGTTVFECKSVTEGAQFSDAHCDKAKEGGAGFKHVEVKPGTTTEIESSNEKTAGETTASTPAILESEALGIKIKIECQKASLTGSLTNNAGPPMNATGSGTSKYTECKELLQGCTVAEPIEVNAKAETKVIKEAAPEEMGGEFKPLMGTTFVVITLSKCNNFLVNGSHEVTGTAIGTPGGTPNGKGATLYFTKAMTEKTLRFAGNSASLEVVTTPRMKASTTSLVATTTAT
jgi:hypothetical protein